MDAISQLLPTSKLFRSCSLKRTVVKLKILKFFRGVWNSVNFIMTSAINSVFITLHPELGSSELLQRANFPVASTGAPLFFEKNHGCSSELSPFHRYSLLWREWWPKEKVRKSSSTSTR